MNLRFQCRQIWLHPLVGRNPAPGGAGPIAAVRDLIHGMDYESLAVRNIAQPESRRNAHEERQPTV